LTKNKGRVYHRPPDSYGDCYRTAVACILGLEPEDVPHFIHDGDVDKADERIAAWLEQNKLRNPAFPFKGEDFKSPKHFLEMLAFQTRGSTFLFGGMSSIGANHMVVARGSEIVWDPSPEDSGIVGPQDDGHYWIEFILPDYARI